MREKYGFFINFSLIFVKNERVFHVRKSPPKMKMRKVQVERNPFTFLITALVSSPISEDFCYTENDFMNNSKKVKKANLRED